MDVRVDRSRCEANGRCVTVAPNLFALDDDEELHVATVRTARDGELAAEAVAACPRVALSLFIPS